MPEWHVCNGRLNFPAQLLRNHGKMSYIAILEYKTDSRTINITRGGVSYQR